MQKYVCTICGHIYDAEEEDLDSNVPLGTAFCDLPDEWSCPVCGAPKSDFEPVE